VFIIVGHSVYSGFQKYTTKAGAVKGAEGLNWRLGTKKFRAFNTDKGWAVYQKMSQNVPEPITPAVLKDENWWRNH